MEPETVNTPADDDDLIPQMLEEGANLAGQGRVHEALQVFLQILERWPDEPRALYNAGVMVDLLGDRDQALTLLARSAAVDPTFARPYLYGGQVALRSGDLTQAEAAFRAALARDVTLEPAYEGLAHIAQRRGQRLVDHDTEIVFYTGGLPFHGNSWREEGLGGSETALIFMARALAQQGCRTRVFCNCDRPGTYDGVRYDTLVDFHIYRHFNRLPLLISSRSLRPFKLPLQAGRRVLWTHDAPNVRYLQDERVASLPIDAILTVSRWQAKTWAGAFDIPRDRFIPTRNGVNLGLFEQTVPRQPHKLLYTSRPDRGLQVLLDLWPQIRAKVPEATLHVFGYRLPDDPVTYPANAALEQPGIVAGGSLAKPDLARELLSARLLVYPATFQETSCMAAIEAMAAGTPVVTSGLAALPETVPDGLAGRIVPGVPHSEDFRRQFVWAVVALMRDDAAWGALSKGARQHARAHHDWQVIAREWVSQLKVEPSTRKRDDHEQVR